MPSNKGFIAVDEKGKPLFNAYGEVLWFKSAEDARSLPETRTIYRLVRAMVPRRRKPKDSDV